MIKNITMSAEDLLIERARKKARQEHKSLNELFRQWLSNYAAREDRGKAYRDLMKRLSYVKSGKRFTRDELNER